LEVDVADLADLDPGDVDRLPLTGRHRLGGQELGLEVEEVLAEERHPARQRSLLLADDHQRRRQAGDREHDHGDQVPFLSAQNPAHGTAAGVGGPGWPAGPLRSGAACVSQATLWLIGGTAPSAGWVPSSGLIVNPVRKLASRPPCGLLIRTFTGPPPDWKRT